MNWQVSVNPFSHYCLLFHKWTERRRDKLGSKEENLGRSWSTFRIVTLLWLVERRQWSKSWNSYIWAPSHTFGTFKFTCLCTPAFPPFLFFLHSANKLCFMYSRLSNLDYKRVVYTSINFSPCTQHIFPISTCQQNNELRISNTNNLLDAILLSFYNDVVSLFDTWRR